MDEELDLLESQLEDEAAGDRSRYTLVRRLGKGGTGETHEGFISVGGAQRKVAIKILVDDPSDEPGRLRALVDQTRRFDSPFVNAPFQFIPSSAGRVVISEFLDGMSVVELQRRLKRLGRPLPVSLALEITAQALEGLIYLHTPNAYPGSPFIHKNIKPSNLFIGADGRVSILDLGLRNPQMEAGNRSKGLAVVNVLPYMAPEQLSDNPKPSPSTDLYSLGTVAYELIAGRPLFDGSAARRELEIRVGFGVQDKIRALDGLVPGIAALLSRALALQPAERFASANEMKREMHALRPEPQRNALMALIRELQALPEKPLTVTRPADAPTAVGAEPPSQTEIRQKLEAGTVQIRKVEPVPAHLLHNRPGGDRRFKVGIGVVSVAIAFLALWWVDRSRQPDPLERISADHALQAADNKASAPPADAQTSAAKAPDSQTSHQ